MAKHTTRGVMRHIATDGSIAELEPFVEQLCTTAKGFAEADSAAESHEARRLLVDAAYYLVWNTREWIGNRQRARRLKDMLKNDSGETHPTMSRTDSSYDGPLLILDTETKLYSVVYMGCTVGDPIDIVGEREKIRAAAAALPVPDGSPAGLPNGKADSDG